MTTVTINYLLLLLRQEKYKNKVNVTKITKSFVLVFFKRMNTNRKNKIGR